MGNMKERESILFCQKPSTQYLNMLESCGDDPRSVAGQYVLNRAGRLAQRGWQPDFDVRDAREK